MNLRRTAELARALSLAFVRDRTALFFTIGFPLIFLLVFGALLGNGGQTSKAHVYVTGPGALLASLPHDAVDAKRVATVAEGLRHVRKGDRPALVYQQGDHVYVRYAASDQVGGATVRGIVGAIVAEANVRAATGTAPPRYTLDARQVEDTSLTSIEFYTPGLLGWAISISGIFGASITLVEWRKKGILRRLQLSPLSTTEIALARIAVSLAIALAQTLVFFGIATSVLGLHLSGAWWMAIPLVLVGTLAFLPLGLIIGGLSKTTEAASAIANLVTLPMGFLSGAFFPLDIAPSWVRTIANLLPLKHLLDALKDVTVRGLGASSALQDLGLLAAFAVVFAVIATRLVRFEDS